MRRALRDGLELDDDPARIDTEAAHDVAADALAPVLEDHFVAGRAQSEA